MHIFLSYSSNDRDIAEDIRLRILALQHAVFFDGKDLVPGMEYDNRIAQEIERTDLFIFLISPDSLTDDRYALTELGMAERRWPHPSTHVLPVMVRQTPMDQIPRYLKAVTILQRSGDIPAMVADHVRRIKPPRPKWAVWAISAIAVTFLSMAVWVISGKSIHELKCAYISHQGADLIGTWWQFTIGKGGSVEQSAISFMKISWKDDCSLKLQGQSWSSEGKLLAIYSSMVSSFEGDKLSYYWEGAWPDDRRPTLTFSGTGEIRPTSEGRASGHFISRGDTKHEMSEKTLTEYRRAQPEDSEVVEGSDRSKLKALVEQRLHMRVEIVSH